MKNASDKIKIVTVVGTRPEIIRLSRVIAKLDKHTDHTIVHTGQNYDFELNEVFFHDLSIRKPDYFLNSAGNSGADTIGKVIIGVEKLLDQIEPEAMLVLGDTNSCMAVIPAKRRKIPTFHMEAGNRCFDMRVPEEINRRIVDHIADCNLCYSDIAREYLLAEGLPADLIIKTGSPMFEVLTHFKEEIESSKILETLGLDKKKFFLVSCHREENIDSEVNFFRLVDTLNNLAGEYACQIIVSTHPRTQKRIESSQVKLNPLVKLLKPLGFHDYNKLQQSARLVLSDSGTISEESSILDFPALNIREAHERPEAMEEASVILSGLETKRVFQGIRLLEGIENQEGRNTILVSDYSKPNVSDKVTKIILSYTDYVNRKVWKKY